MVFRFGATIYQILPNLPKNKIGKQAIPSDSKVNVAKILIPFYRSL